MNIMEWAAKHCVSTAAMSELFLMFEPATIDKGREGSEMGVQQRLRVEAPKFGARLWRNNVGACKDETERVIRYGLGNDSKPLNDVWKSSDLIGITPHVVTPQEVGRTIGIFTAVEVKEPGWGGVKNDHERAQAAFLNDVASRGGIALFATSISDYHRGLGRCSV